MTLAADTSAHHHNHHNHHHHHHHHHYHYHKHARVPARPRTCQQLERRRHGRQQVSHRTGLLQQRPQHGALIVLLQQRPRCLGVELHGPRRPLRLQRVRLLHHAGVAVERVRQQLCPARPACTPASLLRDGAGANFAASRDH
jgi:hypothetical protein